MSTLDEEIAWKLQQAARSGELSQAEGYGKPSLDDDGWLATPAALRMPFKILKDAGVAPPEIALFHERAALAGLLKTTTDEAARASIQHKLSQLEQKIALRLESLRQNASL
jgi:hypothetical protein